MIFDPRTKLYILVLANLLLFFHVSLRAEVIMTVLFLLPLMIAGKIRSAVRLSLIYVVLILITVYLAPNARGVLLQYISMLAVTLHMIWPCIITGTYAFTTTSVSAFVAAMRRMHLPESLIIPCVVVIRYFPTVKEDYGHIKDAMAFRGIAGGKMALVRHPAQSLEYIMIPLLMNATNTAQDLTAAALTKGIAVKGQHTCMTELKLAAMDYVYIGLCTFVMVLAAGGVL